MTFESMRVLSAVFLALALLGSSDDFSEASVIKGLVGGVLVSVFAEEVVVFVALDTLGGDWLDVEDALHVCLSALASGCIIVVGREHFEVSRCLLGKSIRKVRQHFERFGVAKVSDFLFVFFLKEATG